MRSSKFLKQLMKTSGLSQMELAEKLQTTQATISRLMNDKYKISPSLRLRIARSFKYSYDYIFNEVD